MRVPVSRSPIFLLNHPDLIKDVFVTRQRQFKKGRGLERIKKLLGEGLLTSEGDFHLRQRRLMQPAFHRQRVAAYGEAMTHYAAQTSDRWRDGETLDVAEEMMRLTLAIVGKTLFDAEMESEAGEIGGAMAEVISLFHVLMLPFADQSGATAPAARAPLPGRPRPARRHDLPPDRRASRVGRRSGRSAVHAAAGPGRGRRGADDG